jgi:hypothetical protein
VPGGGPEAGRGVARPATSARSTGNRALRQQPGAAAASHTGRFLVPGIDARFTFEDLQRGGLLLAPDSHWLPSPLRNALFKTIRFALDPANAIGGIALSQGVNLFDLYHGHIVMEKPLRTIDLRFVQAEARREAFDHQYKAAMRVAVPGLLADWHPFSGRQPTAEQRRAIRAADRSISSAFSEWIRWLVATFPDGAVIFHTYEWRKPAGITPDSAHRNILTPLAASRGAPAARADVYDYEEAYFHLQQIGFLVAPSGHLYVRAGLDLSLAGLEI